MCRVLDAEVGGGEGGEAADGLLEGDDAFIADVFAEEAGEVAVGRGWVLDLMKLPSGAMDAASLPKLTQGSFICFLRLSSVIMK